jgi:hypothetical protein
VTISLLSFFTPCFWIGRQFHEPQPVTDTTAVSVLCPL